MITKKLVVCMFRTMKMPTSQIEQSLKDAKVEIYKASKGLFTFPLNPFKCDIVTFHFRPQDTPKVIKLFSEEQKFSLYRSPYDLVKDVTKRRGRNLHVFWGTQMREDFKEKVYNGIPMKAWSPQPKPH